MQDLKKKIDRLPKLYIDPGRPGGDEWALSFFDNGALAHTVVGAPAELIVSQKEIIEKLTEREAKLVWAVKITATAELYNPSTGIIDADVLDVVQVYAKITLAELGIETGGD